MASSSSKRSRDDDDERPAFRATSAADAKAFADCAALRGLPSATAPVLMPWIGYGTYKLGAASAKAATLTALKVGYRAIDTAYIYAGEKTEAEVGKAIKAAIAAGIVTRDELCVTTKHWRKFHGYQESLGCLSRSLQRLDLDYVDLWLMHWPGPAWTTMNRRNDEIAAHGRWHYAASGHAQDEIAALRAETWRAMEEALRQGKVRAIGVSNFTIAHLQTLKQTARIWPPAVNQVECHPLYPQEELRAYCAKEGIVMQAYASLGGQDGSKAKWESLGGRLFEAVPVKAIVDTHAGATPAQVLLQWALHKGMAIVPKSASEGRMAENGGCLQLTLSEEEVASIDALASNAPDGQGRLCWRNDPLRMLDFE